ncbi:MAG: class I SAM-dependent methyltransferase [Patescibacteria group bacterium]|nr:class I SAM-dependent methyltransferase [Patescibacteria group bacterium]
MVLLVLAAIFTLACFAGVLLYGAPYLPTLTPQVSAAIKLAELKPGTTLLELGCGDGKVLIAAAQKGAFVVGYELNPIVALVAWLRTRKYRKQVNIIWGNFWKKEWPEADVIFVFLLPKYMEKLNNYCIQYKHKPVKLVSFAFTIPGKTAQKTINGVYRYDYS